MARKKSAKPTNEPLVENRRARHDFAIGETLECGIALLGTEIKSIRDGKISLGEGWVRLDEHPPTLTLMGAHVAEYPPAGAARQHEPTRPRRLLAHRREITKLMKEMAQGGRTIVPLQLYFVRGRAKLLIGVGHAKKQHDKRQDLAKKQARRDIERELARRR